MVMKQPSTTGPIGQWNAMCDAAGDKTLAPFVDDTGRLLVFRCPNCGERFTDADEGHSHQALHETETRSHAPNDDW